MPNEMRPDEVVFSTLLTSGIEGTKSAWPFKKEPPLPWFVFKQRKKGEFYADDGNYAKLQRYEVDLYQSEEDGDQRDAFEEVLGLLGPYACYESWTPMENCWVTSYTLTYHPNK